MNAMRMNGIRKMTMKKFVATNAVLALMFVNVALFGGFLKMGESFTSGLTAGIGGSWVVFFIIGLVSLKRPGRAFDERQLYIVGKACTISFWLLILVLSLAAAAFRSEVLAIRIEAKDAVALFANLGLLLFGCLWFALSRGV